MSDRLAVASYGGQAVIEGVMMRGATTCAIAMRAPSQEILIHTEDLGALYKSSLKKIPFLRGLLMLWDGLGLGLRAITLSANTQNGEDKKLEGVALHLTLAGSLGFSIALFFVIPAAVGGLAETSLGWSAWWGHVVECAFRLSLLITYLWAVGRIPNIRRLFAYHGAEHQTINAFEAGVELTPENVARFPLEHTRCGTSFLLTLVLLSIVIFSVLGPMSWYGRLVSRVVMLPVLAGISYEYTRWAAAHLDSPLVRFLIRPNLALQRLTTRRPSADMLEVAIAAFGTMRAKERSLSPV